MSLQLVNLFCNDLHADMKICIENENVEYPAHKLIIAHASDVLNKMIYGNSTTLPTTTIVVPNCSSKDLLPILKYMYTGRVEWDFYNYDGPLAVGKYFGLTELENIFRIHVAKTINFNNALDFYARFFRVNDYVCNTAMKIIQLMLWKILKSEIKRNQFFELPIEAVSQILQMEELGIKSEKQLFSKMIKWAKSRDQEIIPFALGEKLKFIRFADTMIQIYSEKYGELKDYLHLELNSRWKIKTINSTEDLDFQPVSINAFSLENENDEEHSAEVIEISSRGTPIRIHGLSSTSSEDIYLKINDGFEAIPSYRSKIFNNIFFHCIFKKSIPIAPDFTIRIKAPVSSQRFNFNDLDEDSYSVRAMHMEEAGESLPIESIYISTKTDYSI